MRGWLLINVCWAFHLANKMAPSRRKDNSAEAFMVIHVVSGRHVPAEIDHIQIIPWRLKNMTLFEEHFIEAACERQNSCSYDCVEARMSPL